MAKRRDTAALQVSAEKREAERLALKAEMERQYQRRIDLYLQADDQRMAFIRTPAEAQKHGIARQGKGDGTDRLAAHCDSVQPDRPAESWPAISPRSSAVLHVGAAQRDLTRFAFACRLLHYNYPKLSKVFHLVCFDLRFSEADVARAFDDGTLRNGWTRRRVTQCKVEACALIHRWCGTAAVSERQKTMDDRGGSSAHPP